MLLAQNSVLAQTQEGVEPSWVSELQSNYGFIENLNRFESVLGEKVHYYARKGPYIFFFTQNGLIIEQKESVDGNELWERHEKIEKGIQPEPVPRHHFKISWKNGNPSAIVGEEENPFTVNFQNPENLKQTIKSSTYQSLKYIDIYPNIDLEFLLPDSGGVKYSFHVHPGGNVNDIIMDVDLANVSLSENGDLLINPKLDPFIDRRPIAWTEDAGAPVNIKYLVEENQVRFDVGDYDQSKALIIDPWVEPALPFVEDNRGYDIGIDFEGNVSVLGHHGSQVARYDNTGALLWVWDGPFLGSEDLHPFYGGMDVDPYTGDTYYMLMALFLGIEDVWRIDAGGTVTASIYYIPADDDPGELWRVNYNDVTHQVVVGAGGLPRASHICVIDGDLTTNERYASCPPVPPNLTDATFLEIDPCGESIYLLCSGDDPPLYNNVLYKLDQSDPSTIIWESPTGHEFEEISCIGYMGYEVMTGEGPDWYSANGHNGIACSFDLYTYDGDMLYRWDKITGDLLGSVSVTPPDPGVWGDLAYCGGIDTDMCGNVYVGTEDSLIKYTRELEYVEAIGLVDTCFDLRIAVDRMSACGTGFVESWDFEPWVELELSSTPQPCGSCEGTATVHPSSVCDELEMVQVVWSPGGQTTPTATDLCVGWYTATVTWANGLCDSIVVVDSVEVVIGAPGTLNIDAQAESCDGSCDGSVEITVDGGFPPFVFDMEGDVNATGIYTDLCPGTYDLIVTDVDGCTFVDSVVIEETDSLQIDIITTDEACPGACNGTITLVPENGTPPYLYNVEGEENTTGEFEDLCEGSYTITVEDSTGCVFIGSGSIGVGESMGLDTVVANNPSCYGFSDGSATVGTLLGEEPVTYIWVPENPVPGATFNTMGAGTYTVYAEDANGCQDTLVFEMIEPDSIYVDFSIIDPLCFGDATGITVVDSVYNAQGNPDNITFLWNPDPADVSGLGADSSYNMSADTYTLTINDDFGCSNVVTFTINQPDEMVFSQLGFDPAFCRLHEFQSGNGVVYAAAAGGVPDYTYEWLDLETLETSENSTLGGLNPGYYRITITDANGCILTETVEVDSVNPIAAFDAISDQLDENCEGTELVVAQFVNQSENFANPNDAAADTVFHWNLNHPNAAWQFSGDYFEVFDTSYVGEAIYEVCLAVMNKNGCVDTACKEIIVHVQPEFVAPNIFTPGNGVNDEFTFEFRTLGIKEFHCVIVNRWGVTVAELNSITDGWDGTNKGGENCPDGVYFYSYDAVSTNGTVFNGQGTVQLSRE